MLKFNKLILAFGVVALGFTMFALTSNAETVPGSFTTTGELATPEITVLGLYDQSNSLVSTSGFVTPNTKHSIRFELTNETHAFEDMVITVAFFDDDNGGTREEFDTLLTSQSGRTGIDGAAFVARFGYTEGARVPLEILYQKSYDADDVSWDDTYFGDADLQDVEFDTADNSFEFTVTFNMSKVADVENEYYIGAFASQGIPNQDERFATYASEGPYYTNDYSEFSLTDETSLSWQLEDGETFLDFDGSSASSEESISGTDFSFISNSNFYIDVSADTTWSGPDPENADGPNLEAYLVYNPSTQQEFAIEVTESNASGTGVNIDGTGDTVSYYNKTNESGINGNTLYFYLEVSTENFQDGTYNGNIYLTLYQGLGLI